MFGSQKKINIYIYIYYENDFLIFSFTIKNKKIYIIKIIKKFVYFLNYLIYI